MLLRARESVEEVLEWVKRVEVEDQELDHQWLRPLFIGTWGKGRAKKKSSEGKACESQ